VETMLTLTMKAKHGLFVRPIAKKTSTIWRKRKVVRKNNNEPCLLSLFVFW
jgi:hypothetical protein